MKKNLTFIFVLLTFFGISQKEFLLNKNDSSLVAYVLVEVEYVNEDSLNQYLEKNMNIDSVIQGQYRLEYDNPYQKMMNHFDRVNTDCSTFLDLEVIERFLKMSTLKIFYPLYGIAALPLDNELSVKYGVIFLNEGCVIDDDYPHEYITSAEKLLTLRNGENWKQKYREEYQLLRDTSDIH